MIRWLMSRYAGCRNSEVRLSVVDVSRMVGCDTKDCQELKIAWRFRGHGLPSFESFHLL